MTISKLQSEAVNANIIIQKVAYEMSNARDKAFKAGEIKDGKTTVEWEEYRQAKVKLSQTIADQIQKAYEAGWTDGKYLKGYDAGYKQGIDDEKKSNLILSIQSKGKIK